MDRTTKRLMAEIIVETYDIDEANIGRTIKNLITGRRHRVLGGASARAHDRKDQSYGLARRHMDDYRFFDAVGKLAALKGKYDQAEKDYEDADNFKAAAKRELKRADMWHARANAYDAGKAKRLAKMGFGRGRKG